MIKIEVKHFENTGGISSSARKIIRSEKTLKIFGIVIKKSIYYYPDLKEYEVQTKW